MTSPSTAQSARLVGARTGAQIPSSSVQAPDAATAYAIQDATLAALGPIAGWKVGAPGPQGTISCAPLPASGVLASGAVLSGPFWRWRGMEVEAALRLGQDLLPQGRLLTREELAPTFDAVLPALEVIESRYTDFTSADPMANLADLGCHGALIVGAPMDMAPAALDLLQIDAALHFDGQPATQALGGNAAQDVWRMLAWLALHCEQRGIPLRKGQIVTTGSCITPQRAEMGTLVRGTVNGVGVVEMQFAALP